MPHSTTIKVRGYHLDVYGHVNNARYLEFLEEARWRLFEQHATYEWLQQHQLGFAVVNINIAYRRPALLNDLLQIDSTLHTLGQRSAILQQRILQARTNTVVAEAEVTFVLLHLASGKAIPLDADYRAYLLRVQTAMDAT